MSSCYRELYQSIGKSSDASSKALIPSSMIANTEVSMWGCKWVYRFMIAKVKTMVLTQKTNCEASGD